MCCNTKKKQIQRDDNCPPLICTVESLLYGRWTVFSHLYKARDTMCWIVCPVGKAPHRPLKARDRCVDFGGGPCHRPSPALPQDSHRILDVLGFGTRSQFSRTGLHTSRPHGQALLWLAKVLDQTGHHARNPFSNRIWGQGW